MSILKSVGTSKRLRFGAALGMATAAALAGAVVTGQSAQAAVAKSTASPATGAGAGTAATTTTQVVALTAAGFTDATGVSVVGTAGSAYGTGTGAVQFNAATACPTAEATADAASVYNVTAANFTVVSDTRMIVNAPTMTLGGTNPNYTSKAYRLCVYDNGGTPALLADASYTVYPKPTVTAVSPVAGPLSGGNTVTITGANLTAKTTASVNGVALTGVKVAKDLKSLTGVMPATGTLPKITSAANIAAGYSDIVVTSEGGASATASADRYTYNNEVTVTPKLAKVAGGTTVTVTGKGFTTMLNPTNGAPATNAAVLFVKGQFDATDSSGSATLASSGSCTQVTVVSDSEIVCKTPALATGAYTVTVVSDSRTDAAAGWAAGYQSVVSSSSTVTVAAS